MLLHDSVPPHKGNTGLFFSDVYRFYVITGYHLGDPSAPSPNGTSLHRDACFRKFDRPVNLPVQYCGRSDPVHTEGKIFPRIRKASVAAPSRNDALTQH